MSTFGNMRAAPTRSNFQLEQINAEIFTLTYGSLVRQLLADYDDLAEVHKQLEKMSVLEYFVAKFVENRAHQRCKDFQEAADVIARNAIPMFLNISTEIRDWSNNGIAQVFWDNPLADFVELPAEYKDLKYSNILCGVIIGALESINMTVECDFRKDMLRGDDSYEIRMKLIAHETEQYPFKDDE